MAGYQRIYPPLGPWIQSVSGTLSHGSSVTISGVNFGTHANYGGAGSPYYSAGFHGFDDSQLSGGNMFLADHVDSPWSGEQTIVTIVDSGRSQWGGKEAQKHYPTSDWTTSESSPRLSLYLRGDAASTQKWWISFWFKMSWPCQSGKFFRFWANSSGGHNFYLSTGGKETYPLVNDSVRGNGEYVHPEPVGDPEDRTYWTGRFPDDVWKRVDIKVRDHETLDEMSVYVNRVAALQRRSAVEGRWIANPFIASAELGINVSWWNMLDAYLEDRGWYPTEGTWAYDDIYVTPTWARVELGTSPDGTYASATHLEVQPITNWTTTSVTVDLNGGALTPSSSAYLWVIDADETASNGYPVVLAAE